MVIGARAQAATVLALVATLGALAGVMGDRMIAQRRAEALPQGDTLNILTQQQPEPVQTGDRPLPADREVAPRPGPPGPGPRGGGPPMPQLRFVEMIQERIDLTPEQRTALDSIITEDRARIARITQRTKASMDSVGRSTRVRISALLTPEQRVQVRAIQQERQRVLTDERRARMGDPRGGAPRQRPGRRGGGDTITTGKF
jgi:hypothetical protein